VVRLLEQINALCSTFFTADAMERAWKAGATTVDFLDEDKQVLFLF
jgi:hypothetical protein